jgi:hypothetical protein
MMITEKDGIESLVVIKERRKKKMVLYIRKMIVRLRMWYADFRGHHGHRWDYEPSEHYFGKKPKNRRDK